MGTMPAQPQLLRERLRELRDKRGLSRSILSRRTVTTGYAGVSESTIKSYEVEPGHVPRLNILEALARGLGVDAEEFYEYPIAAAKAGLPLEDVEQALDAGAPPIERPPGSSDVDELPPAQEDEAS